MEFKNLRNNFLFLLGNGWVKSGSLGPYQTELIYEEFSDIPSENISTELESLQANGFVAMTPERDRIYLTERGIAQIEFLLSMEK
jgi:hypothetical protein